MPRHAAPGLGGFFRDLGVFTLKVLFWGVIVFGGVVLIPRIIERSPDTTTTTFVAVANTPATESTATTLPTTAGETSVTTNPDLPATTTTTGPRSPNEVRLQVLNSTDRDGLAAALSQTLSAKGYDVAESDNYAEPLDTSRIWYAPGFDQEAQVLAVEVPDAIVEPAADTLVVDILVVIGASYP